METKVTGCHNCPLLEENAHEGYSCLHPEGDSVKISEVYVDFKSPDSCPLKKESLSIIFINP